MGISISALVRSRVTQLSNVLSLPSPLGKGDHAVVDEVEFDQSKTEAQPVGTGGLARGLMFAVRVMLCCN